MNGICLTTFSRFYNVSSKEKTKREKINENYKSFETGALNCVRISIDLESLLYLRNKFCSITEIRNFETIKY